MQSFNCIVFCLFICAIIRLTHNKVLNDSFLLVGDHFPLYLNTLLNQNSSKEKSYWPTNRYINTSNRFTNKQSFSQHLSEIPLNRSKSALFEEKSGAQSLNAKLEDSLLSFDDSFSPIADINRIKLNMEYLFSFARNSVSNTTVKTLTQHHIIKAFESNNMITSTHKFITTGMSSPGFPKLEGINIIGLRPGKNRNSGEDSILLIGAHYDTVDNTSGVNDNGSGMSALLEIVRLINNYNCQLSYTLMFVAFDLEEYGGIGSRYFVHDYLIPYELISRKSNFEGAIILDTIMNFNETLGSQDIPYDIHKAIPKWSKQIKTNGFVGDFLAVISRDNIDSRLSHHISNSWSLVSKQTPYKLSELSVSSLSAKTPDFSILSNHANLLRSDHIMFWYHNSSLYNETLKAVLVTDTGPFRGYMRDCYHTPCDNTTQINRNNLNFVKLTVEALTRTAVDLCLGECSEHSTSYLKNSVTNFNLYLILSITYLSNTIFI